MNLLVELNGYFHFSNETAKGTIEPIRMIHLNKQEWSVSPNN